jgi:hypothetical protein
VRSIGLLCLIAVILGPAVWLADLMGFSLGWLPVRTAFLIMLGAFAVANIVALVHVVWFSGMPKSQRWDLVHRMFSSLQFFAPFEYLMDTNTRQKRRR